MENAVYQPDRRLKAKLCASAEYYRGAIGSKQYTYKLNEYIDLLRFSVIVLLSLIAIMTFLAEPVPVSGTSMVDTLHNGDRILVEKVSFWFNEPARGDIIICHYPELESSVVKRVIGLPGEWVLIQDNKVYITSDDVEAESIWGIRWEPLDEEAFWDPQWDGIMRDMPAKMVEPGHVFVMGDNRTGSKDSRIVGTIPYSKVDGKAHIIVWPPNRLEFLYKRN